MPRFRNGKLEGRRILFALLGIFLIGTGVAWNKGAALGNDPIGMVYDGVRNAARLTEHQLGTASNFVNGGLIVLLFFLGRRYVNIGTLINVLPYGLFVSIGTRIYEAFLISDQLFWRILTAGAGCLLLYSGVALFIAADIGLDPFTGVVMVLRDKLHKSFKVTKILFDLCMIALGTLLGGTLGVITFLTALTAGPVIQFLSERFQKIMPDRKGVSNGKSGDLQNAED